MSSTKWKPLPNIGEGKPLPHEEVEFILIGAGSRLVKCSNLEEWHFAFSGLPRTGTKSTYTALEMILPGKCHHMAR